MPLLASLRTGLAALCRKFIICIRLPDYAYYINGPETLPPPLSKEEEKVVFAGLEAGNPDCRDVLIVHNLRLVVYIAKKFESKTASVEDMISIGTIGLIKAVNTFRPVEKHQAGHLCQPVYRKRDPDVPAQEQQQAAGEQHRRTPEHRLRRQRAAAFGCSGDRWEPGGSRFGAGGGKNMLLEAVGRLSARERQIMELRFGLSGGAEHTQKEVADMIGISQSYISRLEKRIIKRLKGDLERIS